MFDDDFTLESGPQRRDLEQPEAWERFLNERHPAPESAHEH